MNRICLNQSVFSAIRPVHMEYEPPASALARWNPDIRAAASDDERTINIYDQIGADPWTGAGMTGKLVASVLRRADGADVVVNINSPGGDFFEGLAIHNLLATYKGNVIVNVIGLAASAASVIAMAGDDVNIAESAFIMIHNSWTIALGNRDDMRDIANTLEQFDNSMVALYAARTGQSEADIEAMMIAETWINGKDAVEQGFASAIMPTKNVTVEQNQKDGKNAALRKLDIALAKSAMPRSERRKLLKEISGTPSAAELTTPGAGEDESKDSKAVEALMSLADVFKL